MMIYLAELSTPFLNVSWLLSEMNNAPTLLLITGGLLVLTFFLSRVVVGPYLFYHMITHWLPEGNEVLYYTNFLIVVFFLLMNFYWFMQLLKRVFGSSSEKKKKSEKKSSWIEVETGISTFSVKNSQHLIWYDQIFYFLHHEYILEYVELLFVVVVRQNNLYKNL